MRLFGYEIGFRKAARSLSPVGNGRGWNTVFDSDPTFAFQQDVNVSQRTCLANWAVFSCITLIAGDMGKMTPRLMLERDGILERARSAAFSPVLRKPNAFQTWPQFMQRWTLSKQSRGNAYILLERDGRGVVVRMYVLDPDRVTPLVADDGSVYYRLATDDLAGVPDAEVTVPASEIIHDRMNCLFHPLVGLSPLYAAGLAASQGLKIQENSATFFDNKSIPGGVLTAPGKLNPETQSAIKEYWENGFGGAKRGRVAVLGDGLTYTQMTVDAVDSDLVAQLKMTAEMVCSVFHVPAYKIGIGVMPTYQNAEVLDQIYYDSCIQVQATDAEAVINDGLGLTDVGYQFRFDLDDLIKMDTATQVKTIGEAVKAGIMSPNEARKKMNLPPVDGGESPLAQQQNWPLDVLAEREPPTAGSAALPPPAAPPVEPPADAPEKQHLANHRKLKRLHDGFRLKEAA